MAAERRQFWKSCISRLTKIRSNVATGQETRTRKGMEYNRRNRKTGNLVEVMDSKMGRRIMIRACY